MADLFSLGPPPFTPALKAKYAANLITIHLPIIPDSQTLQLVRENDQTRELNPDFDHKSATTNGSVFTIQIERGRHFGPN